MEYYALDCGFIVHPESFLMGNEATILIRPVLKINDRKCDLSLLKNTKVTLTTRDNKNIPVTKTFTDVKVYNSRELKIDF